MKPRLYCDGGCILKNPSAFGGTWAWYLVGEDDQSVNFASGIIRPEDGEQGLVSNNVAELEAALRGLDALPTLWNGEICSDSQITIGRLFWGWPFRGVPTPLYERTGRTLRRLTDLSITVKPVLMQGHPTKTDLAAGIGSKRGLPVSKWNVACDKACKREAEEVLRKSGLLHRRAELSHA